MAYILNTYYVKYAMLLLYWGDFFVIKSISRDIENKLHIMQSRE